MNVSPNPSTAEAILEVPDNLLHSKLVLGILDPSGKIMEEHTFNSNTSKIQLNASRYSNGIYFIQLVADDGTIAVCRWIINHF